MFVRGHLDKTSEGILHGRAFSGLTMRAEERLAILQHSCGRRLMHAPTWHVDRSAWCRTLRLATLPQGRLRSPGLLPASRPHLCLTNYNFLVQQFGFL